VADAVIEARFDLHRPIERLRVSSNEEIGLNIGIDPKDTDSDSWLHDQMRRRGIPRQFLAEKLRREQAPLGHGVWPCPWDCVGHNHHMVFTGCEPPVLPVQIEESRRSIFEELVLELIASR
jgi:hypothetical protein